MRPLSTHCQGLWRHLLTAGLSSLSFLMHLTVLTDLPCLRKSGPVSHTLLLGWYAAMGPSQLFILGMLSSLAVVVYSREDPPGPLGFSLALPPLVESIKTEVPNLNITIWYLDDGTLCGNPAGLAATLEIIECLGSSRGLFLNRSKSVLYIPRSSTFSSNP